ncbi:MAG: neutral zinc metallopeptidase [Gammaproteobacteria bacterium]|nr:neutral zinc metallopeptidase [Gammaproteobacteria bacterium]
MAVGSPAIGVPAGEYRRHISSATDPWTPIATPRACRRRGNGSRSETATRVSGVLEPGDVDAAAEAIGDDRLQRHAGRRITPDSFTHGSSAQRRQWLLRAASIAANPPTATRSAERPDRVNVAADA